MSVTIDLEVFKSDRVKTLMVALCMMNKVVI